jgi:predicted HTH domain antitoxin
MTISFDLPKSLEQQVRFDGVDLNSKARESLLVELYREHWISHRQLGEALGLEPYETDGVLKKHGVNLDVPIEELHAEAASLGDVRPE